MNCQQIGTFIYTLQIIGKGAYSRVYKGYNTENNTTVAIKCIDKFNLKPHIRDTFYSELNIMKKINCLNIIKCYAFLENDDSYFFVLEYCDGGDLSILIKKSGTIKEYIARDYMIQISSAVKYLRELDIIHRDIKPQNLLLTSDYKIIKLCDFNFARELNDDALAKTLCGSPLYMAPEIIQGSDYCSKSDLWSIGLVLYEMVYGHNPFHTSKNVVELIAQIQSGNFLIFDNTVVTRDCNNLIIDLLRVNPYERLSFEEFFGNDWLAHDKPMFIAKQRSDPEEWESVTLSSLQPKSNSIAIKHNINIVENYVPYGSSPPVNTKSEPIHIKTPTNYTYPISSSAPESSSLWLKCLNTSISYIKKTADIIQK